MSKIRRSGAAAVLALGLMGSSLTTAEARPAPYVPDVTLTVNTTNPKIGGKVTLRGTGYDPREKIAIDLSKVLRLDITKATKGGTFKVKVKLPARYKCEHFLTAKGLTSKLKARVDITIGPAKNCN